MKTSSFFSCLVLAGILFLSGGCSTSQEFPNAEALHITMHPMWGNRLHESDCPYHPNSPDYKGEKYGTSIYSLRNENYLFCHKCGRYVRGRQ